MVVATFLPLSWPMAVMPELTLVAIRTLSLFDEGSDGTKIVLNVGGGIVQDSTAEGEWDEALWKARYAQGLVRRD